MGEKSRLETLWQLWPNTFRMDQGTAYVGKGNYIPGDKVVIDNPRKISYGISGAGDRIGWHEVTVTPDMVGQKVAVFTSIEDKSKTDRIGLNQLIFMLNVLRSGGIAKVYKECEELTTEQALELPRRKGTNREARILAQLREEMGL